jgi:hypothetical protein
VFEKSLAKSGIYRDQMLKTHSEVASNIATYIAELREFDNKHAVLLFLASYYHDIGKGILEKYMGNHKIQFERCLIELEKLRPDINLENRRIVAHLILRHHYTSKEDISKLSEIFVPVDINIDVLLRMLRFCDHLASIEEVNLGRLDDLCKLGLPLEVFAYTISLEGLIAGKIMDLTDQTLIENGGKGIYYHNGSIFIFRKEAKPSINSVKTALKTKLSSYFKGELFKTEEVIGVGDLGKTIFAPIDCLDSTNFDPAWQRVMIKFDRKRQPRPGQSLEDTIDKAYKFVQFAINEIFKHFESTYKLQSPKITLNPPSRIFTPVLKEAEERLGNAKMQSDFTSWSLQDITVVGEILRNYILEKERSIGFAAKDYSEEAVDESLKLLTFSGETIADVERFCDDWFKEYIQVAKEKSIGKEGEKEPCYICGYPTVIQFKEAISKKVSISKIFSNRRPALAPGIQPVKICPLCLSEIKLLDSTLPTTEEVGSLLIVYLERPATVRPPYAEIKNEFINAISDLSEGSTQNYLKTIQQLGISDKADPKSFNPEYALGTNHFYVMFLPNLERQGIQATLFQLSPLMYRLVGTIGLSARMDVGSSMDYAPIQRLLEIPPIGRQYTNIDGFQKEIVFPSEIWMATRIGSIVQFVKEFPKNWCHYFAQSLQSEQAKVLSYLREIYPKVKAVYGMREKEIFDSAMKVSTTLKKKGFSRYAYTRPISIISSAILDAEKAKFDENAIIEYAVNRVLVLSSREIGREIVKTENRDAAKKEIHDDTQELTRKVYDYYKNNGFKDFIMLTRYITDAVYVESQFGGDESD